MGISVTFHGVRGVWGRRVSWWGKKGVSVSVRVEDYRMSDVGVLRTMFQVFVCFCFD